MNLGGITGRIVYSGQVEPFLPYLQAAEILHIGKATSFGLGRVRMTAEIKTANTDRKEQCHE